MKTILVLVDFSGCTSAVVKAAAELAKPLQAKVFLLHVATPEADFEGSKMRAITSREGLADEIHGYLRSLQLLESGLKKHKIDTTALLVRGTSTRGTPTRKLLQEIARIKPGLIIVGSHGHGLLHSVLLGSVSSAVIHKSNYPVLVIPALKRAKSP